MKFVDVFGRNDTWGGLEGICACVGPGWTPLLKRLIADLEQLAWDGELHQVKEKYGTLRFYIGGGSDAIFKRIDEAEDESGRTCENCGEPGKIRGDGWLYTACDKCNAERTKEKNEAARSRA